MVTKYTVTTCMMAGLLAKAALSQSFGDPTRIDHGIGARSLGLAHNTVALREGLPSLFSNPAGLSTGKNRHQFQFSLSGLRPRSRSSVGPADLALESDIENTRLRLGNVGYAFTAGNRRRSLTVGFAYQKPYSLDALLDYGWSEVVGTDQLSYHNQYFATGDLGFWTAGMSLALSPNVLVGGALAVVTGEGSEELRYQKLTNGVVRAPSTDVSYLSAHRVYGGYDARFGMLFKSSDLLNFGFRVELPSVVSFREVGTQEGVSTQTYLLDGYLKSYYAFAAGAQVRLPLIRFTYEINARAPYPRESLRDPPRYWKIGAGFGGEMDVVPGFATVRAGYAWKEYNPTPYVVTYRDPVVFEPVTKTRSWDGDHMISLGGSLWFGRNASFDLGYGHRIWRAETGPALAELNQSQQAMASLTLRY